LRGVKVRIEGLGKTWTNCCGKEIFKSDLVDKYLFMRNIVLIIERVLELKP